MGNKKRFEAFKNELAKQAKAGGICSDWLDRILIASDFGELIEMYYKGLDFCICNQFPSCELINRYAYDEACHAKVYTRGIHVVPWMKRAVVRGVSLLKTGVRRDKIFNAWVCERGRLLLTPREGSTVFVDIFEGGRLLLEFDPAAPPACVILTKWQGEGRIIINGEEYTGQSQFFFLVVNNKETPYPVGPQESTQGKGAN